MPHPGDDDSDPMRIDGLRRSDSAPEADAAEALDGAQRVEGTESTEAAAAVSQVGDAGSISPTEAITDALAAGAIDAEEAKARLIDETVRAQLPPDADPALIESVRNEVAALLEADPVLARLLQAG